MRRQVISRNLANVLNLFLISSLLPVKFSPQPLGWTLGAIRQSAQGGYQEPNGAGNEKDVRTLEPDQSIKRELAGGQEHTYQIKLSVDQFLKMVVEQQGIDVAVQVMGPDGRQIFRFNSEISLRDNELGQLVAEATGDYRLIVQPTQKLAAVGAYEIRIEEMRAATENDRALHEVRKLFDEARKLRDAGKYDEALPLFKRVIETRQRILGPNDRDLADVFFNLAVFYFYKGNYLKAEPLSNRALAIQEKTLGPEHSDVANSLNLLAGLYFNKGDYEKAEPLSNRALAIKEKALGPEHSDLAFYLNKLALIYDKKGEYHKAEPLYVRALAIREKTLGPEHPFVAISLNNLANLYYKKGDYAKSESLHKRALTIREKWLGPQHRYVAESLGNLANIYRDRKDYAQAEPLYLRALAIQEKSLGPQSPHIARTLNYLAMFYLAKGDIAQSIAIQSRANAVTEYNLSLNLDPGSERQKLAFLALVSEQTDFTLSLHRQAAPDNPQALNLAFTTLLRRKARGLDAMTDTIAALRLHSTPRDKELFDRLADARSQLAELTLRESGATLPETSTAQLGPLEEKVENLEAELSIRSAEFRAQAQPITLAAVQAALPADSVLVEFVVHTPWNTRAEKRRAPRYLAYVLSAQGQPKWVDLGETAPIDRAVGAWRRALRDPRRTNFKQLGRVVDEKVMRPVRSLLGDRLGETSHVLIAPEGLLNRIPFAALVDEQNRYLVERFAISYLTSGRDLLRLQTTEPSKSAPLVVANPAFGRVWPIAVRADQSSGEGLAADQARVQIDPARIIFQPLPGTEYEALAIKAVLPEASVLLQDQATEAVLKQARAPRILHIATHGFFLGDQDSLPKRAQSPVNNNRPRAFNLQLSRRIAQVENPLLRSGLALAGANQGKNGDDDGVLTALEAAGLDLWGTKLVVLSACDTGVGEVNKNGEGVQGLRRALVLAGSESQVMSLWPVSDEGTKELMIDYYRALRQGEGRCEGLRQVQLRMLRSKSRRHPFYWAAFIQSGEWAPLEGKR